MKGQFTIWRLIQCVSILLVAVSLAGCSCSPPQPQTVPEGPDISMQPGETISVQASAKGADSYKWTLAGEGQISPSDGQGPVVMYTAPEGKNASAMLTVTAFKGDLASLPTVLKIQSILPETVVIVPAGDTVLGSGSGIVNCPASGARGEIRGRGFLNLEGLKPDSMYYLTLNGKPGARPNDALCAKGRAGGEECYWDFMQVETDSEGRVGVELVINLGGVALFPEEVYDVKFFVKDDAYCTVLGTNDFLFTIESQ